MRIQTLAMALVLALAAFPGSALAKKKKTKGKKAKAEKTSTEVTEEQPESTKSRFGIGPNIAARGLGLGAPGFGGSAFFELSPKIAAFSSLLIGNADVSSSLQSSAENTVTVEKAAISSLEILAGARYFFTQSTYATGATGIRRITSDSAFSSDEATLSMQTQSLSILLSTSIGNRWYFGKSFYVSGDWLAYQLAPVSKQSYTSSADGFDDETADFLESITSDLATNLGKAGVLTAINLSFGMAF
jgi:hypothetical protein